MNITEALGFQQSGAGFTAFAQVPTESYMTGLLPGTASGGGGSGGSSPPSFVLSATGPTLPIVLNQLDAVSGKEVYLGQIRALFVDADFARAGLTALAAQLFQMPYVPQGAPLAVFDGPLLPLLQAKLVGTDMAGRFVDMYFRTTFPRAVARIPLWSFFVTLHTPGITPTLPVFRLVNAGGQQPTMEAEGTAVFRGGRMIRILTGADNQGLLIWRNSFGKGALFTSSQAGGLSIDDAGAVTTYGLLGWENGLPVIGVRVRVFGALHGGPHLLSPGDVRTLQQEVSQQIQQEMQGTLGNLQEVGSDAIGIGTWLDYHNPRAFARLQPWPDTFTRLRVQIRVTTSLKTAGWRA